MGFTLSIVLSPCEMQSSAWSLSKVGCFFSTVLAVCNEQRSDIVVFTCEKQEFRCDEFEMKVLSEVRKA